MREYRKSHQKLIELNASFRVGTTTTKIQGHKDAHQPSGTTWSKCGNMLDLIKHKQWSKFCKSPHFHHSKIFWGNRRNFKDSIVGNTAMWFRRVFENLIFVPRDQIEVRVHEMLMGIVSAVALLLLVSGSWGLNAEQIRVMKIRLKNNISKTEPYVLRLFGINKNVANRFCYQGIWVHDLFRVEYTSILTGFLIPILWLHVVRKRKRVSVLRSVQKWDQSKLVVNWLI